MSMNTEEIKTPRTDAQYKEYARRDDSVKCVEIDFVRQLERELAEAKARISEMEKDVEFYRSSMARVAVAVGVDSPLQLTVLAENNTETYVDLLLKHIARRDAAMAAQH